MKKVGLILGANIEYAPYVQNYIKILKELKIDYKVIEYKKVDLENKLSNIISFKDNSNTNSILGKIIGYIKFKNFLKLKILEEKFDFLVLFTPQIYFLGMSNFFQKHYFKKYILDIRDYNIIFRNTFILKKLIKNSKYTVISSKGFKKWLPTNLKYIIDHNINEKEVDTIFSNNLNTSKIKILNCGVIRSFEQNLYLIRTLKDSKNIEIEYRGESVISKRLKKFVEENKIKNVSFYGYYRKENENYYIEKSNFLNIMQTDDFLSRYALPNRFYKALLLKKIIIATSGNYVGNLVEKYNLGIVLNKNLSEKFLEDKIKEYLNNFNAESFNIRCNNILKKIYLEKNIFEKILKDTFKD